MATRTYGDGCSSAHALDLIGERWALLIVRDLLFGPKRFTDLHGGLPQGSPTCSRSGFGSWKPPASCRRRSPPPASAKVYELTEWGAEPRADPAGPAAVGRLTDASSRRPGGRRGDARAQERASTPPQTVISTRSSRCASSVRERSPSRSLMARSTSVAAWPTIRAVVETDPSTPSRRWSSACGREPTPRRAATSVTGDDGRPTASSPRTRAPNPRRVRRTPIWAPAPLEWDSASPTLAPCRCARRHFESRTYRNGETVRKCDLDLTRTLRALSR